MGPMHVMQWLERNAGKLRLEKQVASSAAADLMQADSYAVVWHAAFVKVAARTKRLRSCIRVRHSERAVNANSAVLEALLDTVLASGYLEANKKSFQLIDWLRACLMVCILEPKLSEIAAGQLPSKAPDSAALPASAAAAAMAPAAAAAPTPAPAPRRRSSRRGAAQEPPPAPAQEAHYKGGTESNKKPSKSAEPVPETALQALVKEVATAFGDMPIKHTPEEPNFCKARGVSNQQCRENVLKDRAQSSTLLRSPDNRAQKRRSACAFIACIAAQRMTAMQRSSVQRPTRGTTSAAPDYGPTPWLCSSCSMAELDSLCFPHVYDWVCEVAKTWPLPTKTAYGTEASAAETRVKRRSKAQDSDSDCSGTVDEAGEDDSSACVAVTSGCGNGGGGAVAAAAAPASATAVSAPGSKSNPLRPPPRNANSLIALLAHGALDPVDTDRHDPPDPQPAAAAQPAAKHSTKPAPMCSTSPPPDPPASHQSSQQHTTLPAPPALAPAPAAPQPPASTSGWVVVTPVAPPVEPAAAPPAAAAAPPAPAAGAAPPAAPPRAPATQATPPTPPAPSPLPQATASPPQPKGQPRGALDLSTLFPSRPMHSINPNPYNSTLAAPGPGNPTPLNQPRTQPRSQPSPQPQANLPTASPPNLQPDPPAHPSPPNSQNPPNPTLNLLLQALGMNAGPNLAVLQTLIQNKNGSIAAAAAAVTRDPSHALSQLASDSHSNVHTVNSNSNVHNVNPQPPGNSMNNGSSLLPQNQSRPNKRKAPSTLADEASVHAPPTQVPRSGGDTCSTKNSSMDFSSGAHYAVPRNGNKHRLETFWHVLTIISSACMKVFSCMQIVRN